MTDDLYKALGVGRDADRKEIRNAYRKRAKATHPDAGGSAAEFETVSRAMRVLSDDRARERYDRTGDASERPDNTDARARQLIASALSKLLNDGFECEADLVAILRGCISSEQLSVIGAIGVGRADVARAEKVRRRLKTTDRQDPIGSIIDHRLATSRRALADAEDLLQSINAALSILNTYSFEVDMSAAASRKVDPLIFGTMRRPGGW